MRLEVLKERLEKKKHFKESAEDYRILKKAVELLDELPKNGATFSRTRFELQQLLVKSFDESYSSLVSFVLEEQDREKDFRSVCDEKFGWLWDFLQLTNSVEAPGIFLASSALAAMSYALGRKWWTQTLFTSTFPSFSTILVGPSGSKKSSSISLAESLIEPFNILRGSDESFDPSDGPPSYEKRLVIRDKITPERLLSLLNQPFEQREQIALLMFGELATGLGRQSYQSGFIPLLTRLMDEEREFQDNTVGRGKIKIFNTSLILVGGTTADWLVKEISSSAVAGGTTSRIVFVHSQPTAKIIPTVSKTLRSDIEEIGSSILLTIIDREGGKISWTKDAQDFYDFSYSDERAEQIKILREDPSNKEAGWYSRKYVHVARLALLLAVTNGHPSIRIEDVEAALTFINFAENSMKDVFDTITAHPKQRLRRDILALAMQNKWTLSDMTEKLNHYDPSDIRTALAELRLDRQISISSNGIVGLKGESNGV